MPPLRQPRLRLPVVAVGAALVLVCAIVLLLRADSGRGQGGNRILPPPAVASVAPARGSCLVPVRTAERFASRTRRRVVALTFDDGPGPATAAILGQLRRAGQHATFFVIGRQVAPRAADLARAVREGNAIGNHTWDHADVSAGDAAAAGELWWTSRAIRRATGAPPCVLRAPYGRTGPGLVAAARAQGMVVTEWNVDPQDWRSPSPAGTAHAVLSALRPGAIVLLHDGGPNGQETRAALPAILRGLARGGYRSVTVPALLHLRRAR
jgi:peptidoglycan/xylan/chitin deacetylase (PgdA/CDA1 family)